MNEQLIKDIQESIKDGRLTQEDALRYIAYYNPNRIRELGLQLSENTITLEQFNRLV